MKKILFLLLIAVASYGQTYQNPTFGTVTTKTAPTSTTDPYVGTVSSTGVQGKVAPENMPLTIIPPTTNYTPVTPNLKGHFQGIDNALGDIVATTAGNTTRVWFTGDATTIGAGTFYLSNATGKGTVANVSQSVTNDDNQKKYFTQDLIGQPFASNTLFPPGVYAGNLSASTTPNSAQQRFTVELYKCDNNGTPIASGVSGAPVGDLGVTVVLILDSGLLTLVDGSVTNVPVSASLATQFSISTGERIRYHVSAEKVGTVASNITESVWYGSSFNSYLDVPTPITSSGVSNLSTVTGATVTVALDNLNIGKENVANKAIDFTTVNNTLYPSVQASKTYIDSKIPTTYAKIVYVNNANPNSATIFDLNTPPTINDNALKIDVNNLYIGSDASTWVYNGATYVTKVITSSTSNFYFAGTTTDAQDHKTAPLARTGSIQIRSLGNITGVNLLTLSDDSGNSSRNFYIDRISSTGGAIQFRTTTNIMELDGTFIGFRGSGGVNYFNGCPITQGSAIAGKVIKTQISSNYIYQFLSGSTNGSHTGLTNLMYDINTDNAVAANRQFSIMIPLKIGNNTLNNASTIFDVETTTKGSTPFPRMTAAQRTAIATPTTGLMIYQTDATEGIYVNKSTGYTRIITDSEILSGSATLDFPSTGSGTNSDLTITVTGAVVGDVVSVGIPAADANSCYTARVSAANTVSVRFNNYSTGSIDPISGTFKVKVLK